MSCTARRVVVVAVMITAAPSVTYADSSPSHDAIVITKPTDTSSPQVAVAPSTAPAPIPIPYPNR